MFKKIYETSKRISLFPLNIITAQSKPLDSCLSPPHYLILIQNKYNDVPYKYDWFEDSIGEKVTDPTKARVGYKLAHYGRTTFAFKPPLREELIVPRLPYEPIYDYLEKLVYFIAI